MVNKLANNLTQEYWDKLLYENTDLKGVGWPNWPESYNLILYKKYLKCFDEIIKDLINKNNFNFNENTNIFEVGPGTGFYTNYFFRSGIKNYTGADISEVSVEKLKEKYPNFHFVRKDISLFDSFISQNENKFDIICVVDVLLHITDESKFLNSISNLSKMLKQGGYMIIGDAITIYRKKNISEGTKYTHNVSRHIDYIKGVFLNLNLQIIGIYNRKNFLLNNNFDFKYPIFEIFFKPFFLILNTFLSLFRNSNLIGKLIGYPLSLIDSVITPFQKYSKNSKFLLLIKNP